MRPIDKRKKYIADELEYKLSLRFEGKPMTKELLAVIENDIRWWLQHYVNLDFIKSFQDVAVDTKLDTGGMRLVFNFEVTDGAGNTSN